MSKSEGHYHVWRHERMTDGTEIIECACGAYISVYGDEVSIHGHGINCSGVVGAQAVTIQVKE